MRAGAKLLLFVTLQRLVELAIAWRNTARLRRRGAHEAGAGHYAVMVTLHASWLATLWMYGRKRAVSPALVGAFALLQVARVWVLRTLGERWTTRIMLLPDAAPIVTGPYRFVRHPNYAIVALELPCVALALGLRRHAVVFGTLNVAMLGWRIRCENRAYAAAPNFASLHTLGCTDTGTGPPASAAEGDGPICRSS